MQVTPLDADSCTTASLADGEPLPGMRRLAAAVAGVAMRPIRHPQRGDSGD